MDYAFRVFAAIYGHRVIAPGSDAPASARHFLYAKTPSVEDGRTVHIPALYRANICDAAIPELARHRFANEELYLAFDVDPATRLPDWLGELFIWLSSSYESSITARDSIGRVPYGETVFAKRGLSMRKPHAMLLMAWLESHFQSSGHAQELTKAPSPVPGIEHFVICSHDVDYFYTNRRAALVRLFKNLLIAYWPYKSWSFLGANLSAILNLLRGDRTGEYLAMLANTSDKYHFTSTVFVVAVHGDRRDPNYALQDLLRGLRVATTKQFAVAMHGSYQSIVEQANLLPELAAIEAAIGTRPLGGRQHWLRFSNHQAFFRVVETAGLLYDSTLGFAEAPGFRNGACFAFPPYDFQNERPFPFLEIPLALMDGNVEAGARLTGESAASLTTEVLQASRKWGWGGIALDWHNPMEALQVPPEINDLFWNNAQEQSRHCEKWISAETFLSSCLNRYQNAGLLLDAKLHA